MHTLICGVTESGKTTLARALAAELEKAGENLIVYDPVHTRTIKGGWPASSVIFSDQDSLFDYLSRDDVSDAHIFIDEAGDVFNLGQRYNMWLLTRGRHFGFSVTMIAQRPKMIAPSARGQVSRVYMFRLAQQDAREIGADMGHSALEKINLDKGDFLILDSGQASMKRANIFKLLRSQPK